MEQRRAKEVRRRSFRTGAFAFIPVKDWWAEIPWYPGSVPTKEEISVTETFGDPLLRVEAMSLTSCDSVETVIRWYLSQMQRLGWCLVESSSRIEQVGSPDHRWLDFRDQTGQLKAEIQVKELGKYLPVPAAASPEARELTRLLQEKWGEIDQQKLARNPKACTDISLSRSERTPLAGDGEGAVGGQDA